jgi:hypothetical protein
MTFAIMASDHSWELQEVAPKTAMKLKRCIHYALRMTSAKQTNQTLYVLLNDRNWLSDPLTHIQACVEAQGAFIKDHDLSKLSFTLETEDEEELNIFIIGGGEKPAPATDENEDADEEEVIEVKQEVVEVKQGVVEVEQEVIEILDTSGKLDFDSKSESDYEDFTDQGLTQFVHRVDGAPFKLPPF